MIKILNTISGKKEEFVPMSGKRVQMFVCGPTVYDYIHIGNARTFVFFDVVAKYLKYKGYEVDYIQNITDIDNKIIERAQKEGVGSLEYAKKYTEIFKEDMKALGVTSPKYKNATDHIPEVIKQVQTLLDKGNAYVIENDGIYFDLSTFPDYGKLSGRTASMADDAVSRIDDSDKKRNRGDFAIWKFSQEGDPAWDFETGEYLEINDGRPAFVAFAGRPGWHIEDTAITEKYFGPQYDLHGGGQDLIFPHHEAEITQQCTAAGIKPEDFVKYWMHVAFVVNKGQKMSKSLGNFAMAHDLLKKYPKEVLRFYLLSGYYRSPLDFSEKILEQFQAGVQRLSEIDWKLAPGNLNLPEAVNSNEAQKLIEKYRLKIEASLDSDFNTPVIFSEIFSFIKELNKLLSREVVSKQHAFAAQKMLNNIVRDILGVLPVEFLMIPAQVMSLIEKRGLLRDQKNYAEADKLRAQIEELGYLIEDTIYGPLVKKG